MAVVKISFKLSIILFEFKSKSMENSKSVEQLGRPSIIRLELRVWDGKKKGIWTDRMGYIHFHQHWSTLLYLNFRF